MTQADANSGGAAPETVPPAIELRGISKSFGLVEANKDIHIRVRPGTIHGIIGENGAGKSTMMSILYGFYQADSGEILVDGKPVRIAEPTHAIRAGIGMVFQHFKLVQNFTVLENVILGAEGSSFLKSSKARARALLTDLAREYELQVNPDAVVEDLSVGHQQRVEILKALYREANILILDEPTGVLTPSEADHLFRILKGLAAEGKTIILITHKLREIMDVTDAVSVMRRGEMVATLRTADTTPTELAELMVGRKVLLNVSKTPAQPGRVVLSARGLTVTDRQGVARLKSVDLDLRAGEILGIAGVSGNGQSELLEVLAGMIPGTGQVTLNNHQLDLSMKTDDPRKRREAGISHVHEDRHRCGLILNFMAWENTAFGYHHAPEYQKNRVLIDNDAILEDTRGKIARFDVRPPNPMLTAESFSGGNQQKIVLAREIERNPDLLLVGQPTRGVDIGAIEFIHKRLIELRDQGKAILLVSVELDEIMALSDRIVVMFDGQIMGERLPAQTNARELGLMMAGMTGDAA
ncbi:MAG: ABC transporter ATP-binding protein [Roseinatronobacter sp.]